MCLFFYLGIAISYLFISPSSEAICFYSCLFNSPFLNTQSPLIGQLTHAWSSTTNNNRAAMLNQFSHAKLAVKSLIMQMYESHIIEGETTDEVFQEQRGASLLDCYLFNFQDLLNAQDPT